ncbi:MAG: chlorite dismutase family protein [Acidimicrobiia bacterium]|nr:chlorite dismutase family protein [Acidimicrobiia bacterium]
MTDANPAAQLSEGLGVLHLFWRLSALADRQVVLDAIGKAEADGHQVVTVAMLGHKADLALMALADDFWALRRLQTELSGAGLELVDSYLSITEVSEYAAGVPDEMKTARLYPDLPPAGKTAWCFYPMSKRRQPDQNWYLADFERRKELMYEHGASGRKFAGRLVQLITASTGLDDYEWGVTLFAERPDDLKDVVYTMRFDEASAVYADFGPFYTGMVARPPVVLEEIGLN